MILKTFGKFLMTGVILIDLQKAFNTIDHHVLQEISLGHNFSPLASASCGETRIGILSLYAHALGLAC